VPVVAEVAGLPDDPGTLLCIAAVVVIAAALLYLAADRHP
jgi:hypothetical protein